MKKETKERIAWMMVIFGVACYLGNYYFLIFLFAFKQGWLGKLSGILVEMLALWPSVLFIVVMFITSFLFDSAERDIQKGGNHEDN